MTRSAPKALCVSVLLFVAPLWLRAQYAIGASALIITPTTITGIASTELDYIANLYYDPKVDGFLYRGGALAGNGSQVSAASYVAAVALQSPALLYTTFQMKGEHWVRVYYWVEVESTITYEDYFGFSLIPSPQPPYGGYEQYSPPCYYVQIYEADEWLGRTSVDARTWPPVLWAIQVDGSTRQGQSGEIAIYGVDLGPWLGWDGGVKMDGAGVGYQYIYWSPDYTQVNIRYTIAADAPAGPRNLWFETIFGASNPQQFTVEHGASLALDRPSLDLIVATGSPAPAVAYSWMLSANAGLAPYLQYGSGVTAQTHPNSVQITAPPNPGASPAPGGLSVYKFQYQAASGMTSPEKLARLATFGVSCYIIALESEHWDSQTQSCKSMTINQVQFSGRWQDPPGLPGTNYCAAFIADVRLNGSGQAMDGAKIKYNPNNGTWYVVPEWSTADGGAPVPYQTVARDRTLIPAGTAMSLNGIGPNAGEGFIAHDVGQAIGPYRVDVYTGMGRSSGCRGWSNPIVVGTCSPPTATCPARNLE